MSAWRRKIIEIFPESKREIESFYNKSDLWIYLNEKFINAYNDKDDKLAMRIVGFYRWCVSPDLYPLPNDLQTNAAISFLEYNTLTDTGIKALFKYLTVREILTYRHLIAYVHKLNDENEVLKFLKNKISELEIDGIKL